MREGWSCSSDHGSASVVTDACAVAAAKPPPHLRSAQTSVSEEEGGLASDGTLTEASEGSSDGSGMVNPITGERTGVLPP